jgi:hypothetical protein
MKTTALTHVSSMTDLTRRCTLTRMRASELGRYAL